MSTIFTAREIAETALRKIGALSINDDAAEANELRETLKWLDLAVAEQAGTERTFWLVPDTLTVPLSPTVPSYDLLSTLGANAPANGIQFPIHAKLITDGDREDPLDIIYRREFEDISKKSQTGAPEKIYIDRIATPTMTVWPVPGAGHTNLAVKLQVQTFAPKYTGDTDVATGLRAAWQRWAIFQVSADIGDGPVLRLPRSEVDGYRRDAGIALGALEAFENREHTGRPRITRFRDF